jgi:hypothetical protein
VRSLSAPTMQFLLLVYDGKDSDALGRRLAFREQHLSLADQLVAQGKMLFASAILDARSCQSRLDPHSSACPSNSTHH